MDKLFTCNFLVLVCNNLCTILKKYYKEAALFSVLVKLNNTLGFPQSSWKFLVMFDIKLNIDNRYLIKIVI